MIRLANYLSVVLHPVVVLLLTSFVVVSRTTQSLRSGYGWTLYAGAYLILLCLFIAWGVRRKIFTDLDVSMQSQRKLLYVAAAIIGLIYVASLIILKAPNILLVMAAAVLGLVAALAIVNRRIKASGHVACISVFASSLILQFGTVAFPALLLIPLLAWSRVTLRRHTIQETCVGAALGIVTVLIIAVFAR